MLHMAAGPGGTAPQAQTSGYSVGGKTGTARKQEGKYYVAKKYRTFFVGLAPIEDPRIVVAVMVDEPNNGSYYAGVVADRVVTKIAGKAATEPRQPWCDRYFESGQIALCKGYWICFYRLDTLTICCNGDGIVSCLDSCSRRQANK